MLEDFGSLNGTFVNGQRIKTAALNISTPLPSANTKFTFRIPGSRKA